MSLALVTLVGNVGGDPETTAAGNADVVKFSLAVNRKAGREDVTDWYRCISFYDVHIKLIEEHVKKGMKMVVCGQLAQQKWEDRENVERITMEVRIDKIEFADGPRDGGGRGDAPRGRDDDRGRGGRDAPRGRDDDRGRGRDDRGSRDDRSARDDRGGRGYDRDAPRGASASRDRDAPRGRDDGRGRDDDRGRGAPAGGGGGWLPDDEIPFEKSWQ